MSITQSPQVTGTGVTYSTDASGNVIGLVGPSGNILSIGSPLAMSAVPISLTGTTTATVMLTVSVKANVLGPNGALRITCYYSMTNNANLKRMLCRWGTAATECFNANLASLAEQSFQVMISNRGATGSQILNGGGTGVSLGAIIAHNTASEDTTVDQNIQFIGTLATAGDTITIERYIVELLR